MLSSPRSIVSQWLHLLVALVVALGAVTVCAASAAAQSDPLEALTDDDFDRVVEWLERAREAEQQEQWRVALGYFEQVSAVVVLPEVRIREARAHAALGNISEAAEIYGQLAAGDSEVADRAADELRELADAHPPVLRLGIAGTEATVRVNGRRPQPYGVGEHELELEPGEHVIDVEADDNHPVRLELSLGVGETAERYVTFVAAPPSVVTEPAPATPDETRTRDARVAVPISLTVLSVGAFGVGGWLGSDASNRANTYRSRQTQALSTASQTTSNQTAVLSLQDERSAAQRQANLANGMFGTGAALAAGAVVTWWWALRDNGRGDSDIAVFPTLGGGAVRVGW